MKNFICGIALMGSMLAVSCSSTLADDLEQSSQTANVTFIVKQNDFQRSFTRAEASSVLKNLDLALYTVKDGVYTKYADVSSVSSDNGFGTLSLSDVSYGTYTLLSVGNASTYGGHSVLSDIHQIRFQESKLPVTYYVCQQVTVDANTTTIPLELVPACASFRLAMNGKIPSNTANVRLTVTNASTCLDATTGLAPASKISDFCADQVIPESYWGLAGQTVRVNMFLSAAAMLENSGISIKAEALDSEDNVIVSYDFEDVPMQVGCITTYTGNFFESYNPAFSFTVDNNWGSHTGTY